MFNVFIKNIHIHLYISMFAYCACVSQVPSTINVNVTSLSSVVEPPCLKIFEATCPTSDIRAGFLSKV